MTDGRVSTLNTVIDDAITSRLKQVHTCTPGIIDEFDPATGLASIQPSIKRLLVNGKEITLPKLTNCPIGNLKAGNYTITLPVAQGDECMIHFTERSMDAWIKFGDVRLPNDKRMHSLSDAYFIPMSTSESKATSSYDTENLVIRSTSNAVKITLNANDNSITLDAPGGVTMNGDVSVIGALDVTGNSTASNHISGGISGSGHTHTGNQGSPTSGPI